MAPKLSILGQLYPQENTIVKILAKRELGGNAVSTPRGLGNKEVLEAGVVVRPTISKTGPTTQPEKLPRSAMESALAPPPFSEH